MEENKDITCPLPQSPKPTDSTPGTPQLSPRLSLNDTPEAPPPRKKRKCGKCGDTGHNTRTCTHLLLPLFKRCDKKENHLPLFLIIGA